MDLPALHRSRAQKRLDEGVRKTQGDPLDRMLWMRPREKERRKEKDRHFASVF